MFSFTVDTLKLIDTASGFKVVTNYTLGEIGGLDLPDMRNSMYDRPGEDGAVMTNQLYGSRLITLSGLVFGLTPMAYFAARKALSYAVRVQKDTYGFPLPLSVTFTTNDGLSYQVDTYIKKLSFAGDGPMSCKFMIQLVAPDPSIYGVTALTSGQVTRRTNGGALFNLLFTGSFGGFVFSSGTGGVMQIDNTGNFDTWPIIYLRGVQNTPTFYHRGRDKTMRLNYATTSSSDVIEIDMKEHTIVLNSVTNLAYAKDDDSDWWSLTPGVNLIDFTTATTGDPGTAEVTAKPAMMAV